MTGVADLNAKNRNVGFESANPTASLAEVKKVLKGTAQACVLPNTGGQIDPDSSLYCGAGIPNASQAVGGILGSPSAVNRLTPLFSLYLFSDTPNYNYDHVYTVFPQMANAAIWGTISPRTMTPQDPNILSSHPYIPIGDTMSHYLEFPGHPIQDVKYQNYPPRAIASVFTTFVNPIAGGSDLVPLYRYSRTCSGSNCSQPIRHMYSTDFATENPILTGSGYGYVLDGIEGYVFPKSPSAQQYGAVKLCRKYDSGKNDMILFSETGGRSCTDSWDHVTPLAPADQTYDTTPILGSSNWIGWVFPVSDPHPVCAQMAACPAIVWVPGDFDNDHKSDILWEAAASSAGPWTLGMSSGTSIGPGNGIYSGNHHVVSRVGDFDGDGHSDILWQQADGTVGMTLMNGTTPATSPVLYTEAGWTIVGTGDFNGDGKSDIVWRRSSDGLVTIWLMNANTQNGWTYFNFGTDWTVVGIGDFDGDGKSDILWRNSSTGLASMWLMNGLALKNPTAEIGWTYFYCGTDWTIAGTGDFDGDGKSDILWRNTSTGLVTLWLMNGLALKDWGPLYTDLSWTIGGTEDFDGDGKADILRRNPSTGAVEAWLMNGKTLKNNSAQSIYPLYSGSAWKPVGLQ